MAAPSSQPIPLPIVAEPGIQKDGTAYRANAHVNGQWVRFKNAWAQKMLGFERIQQGNDELIVNMFEIPNSDSTDVYLGRGSSVRFFNITNEGVVGDEIDRTPIALKADRNNSWSFCTFSVTEVDGLGNSVLVQYIFAQVNNDRINIAQRSNGQVFYGRVNDTTPLQVLMKDGVGGTQPLECSGSIIAYPPVLVALDNDGVIKFSEANNPFLWQHTAGTDNLQPVGNTKCIAGLSYQGFLIMWTLNELFRLTYVPEDLTPPTPRAALFEFSTIMSGITILSPNSIVSYQNLIFWVGIGQFYIFNGSVQRLENNMNSDYFFDTINKAYKGTVWAIANPQFDEVIFFFPGLGQSEPTRSVSYGVGKQKWWNNDWERSSGIVLSTYEYPLMASSTLETSLNVYGQPIQTYPLWQHEKAIDKVVDGIRYPIYSFIQYPYIDLFTKSPGPETNRLMITQRIELDFIVRGILSLSVLNFNYPQSDPDVFGPVTFTVGDEYIDNIISQGRIVSILLESTGVGGYYECGKPLQDIILGDFNPVEKQSA